MEKLVHGKFFASFKKHGVITGITLITLWAIWTLFFHLHAGGVHSTSSITVSGTDVSDGSARTFIATDISAVGISDDVRLQSDGNWPKSTPTYDETRYIEFVFNPSIPADATIVSVSVTNEYRRTNTLTGAKLEVWDGTGWTHAHTLTIPADTVADATDSIDISSYINTVAKVNGLKVRFLAYNSGNQNVRTQHDFIKIQTTFSSNPTILALCAIAVGAVFISSTRFLTQEINRVFTVDADGSDFSIDLAHYKLVAHKLGLPEEITGTPETRIEQPPAAITSTSTPSVSTATPELDKSAITLAVYNATSVSGLAGKTKDKLAAAGFTVSKTGNAKAQSSNTITLKESATAYAPLLREALGTAFADATINAASEDALYDAVITIGKK